MTGCGKCGQAHTHPTGGHPTCTGHRSKARTPTGGLLPCYARRIPGADVCYTHGGASPQVQAVAAARVRDAAARQLAARHSIPVDAHPTAHLMELITVSAGLVRFYETKVAELDPDLLVRGTRSIVRSEAVGYGPIGSGTTTTTEVGPEIHAWLRLWTEERDRLAKLCLDVTRVGIDAKLVSLAERDGATVGTAFLAIAGGIGAAYQLSPAAREGLQRWMGRVLRAVEDGQRPPVLEIPAALPAPQEPGQ